MLDVPSGSVGSAPSIWSVSVEASQGLILGRMRLRNRNHFRPFYFTHCSTSTHGRSTTSSTLVSVMAGAIK